MCGLVGVLLSATNGAISTDAQAFEELLYVNALRGEDSTGVVVLHNNGEMRILKDACDGNFFRYTDAFRKLRQEVITKGKFLLGHNRKKTIGKIDPETAHPFLIGDRYAFTHNGTLQEHKKLADTEVDSEALGIHLTACEGSPAKLEKALSEVMGAYACVWVDQLKEKVYILRNSERPLYIAKTNAGYMYASESSMIYLVCNRNRIKIESCELIDVDTLYTVSIPNSGYGLDLQKEKLTFTKKSIPSTSKGRGTKVGGVGTQKKISAGNNVIVDLGGTSKNAFKRFRNKNLGKVISFYLDDFVEKHYPHNNGDWLLFGKSDDLSFNHVVCGYAEGVTQFDIEDNYMNKLAYGVIQTIEYEETTRTVKILVNNLTLYRPSTKETKNETVKH